MGSDEHSHGVTTRQDDVLLINDVETARRLGLSKRGLYRLVAAGKLPKALTISSRLKRWRAQEIADWVAAGMPDRRTWESIRN